MFHVIITVNIRMSHDKEDFTVFGTELGFNILLNSYRPNTSADMYKELTLKLKAKSNLSEQRHGLFQLINFKCTFKTKRRLMKLKHQTTFTFYHLEIFLSSNNIFIDFVCLFVLLLQMNVPKSNLFLLSIIDLLSLVNHC